MSITRLDHYSIRTTDLEATRRFYTEVMGFEVGPRPDFPFPGVWLYQGGAAVVHVIGIDPNDNSGLQAYLGDRETSEVKKGAGTIDHIAFAAQDIPGMRARFAGKGTPVLERTVPSLNLHQMFLEDPNGITIELNFPA